MSKRRKMVLLVIVTLLAISIAVVAFAALDLVTYTATQSETLEPLNTPIGKALVVYNPGLSGQARQAARIMAEDLRSEGYIVTLAGVRSSAADNISDYSVIIVGGPMYGGTVSSSIADYLKGLTYHEGLRLGVFATTGNAQSDDNSYNTFRQNVDSLLNASAQDEGVEVKLILTVDVEEDCHQFVGAVLARE